MLPARDWPTSGRLGRTTSAQRRQLTEAAPPARDVGRRLPRRAVRPRPTCAPRSAGTRSTTAWPGPSPAAPRSSCCTTTPRRIPRAACGSGASCDGGMGVLTATMADAAREAGAEIRTGAGVARSHRSRRTDRGHRRRARRTVSEIDARPCSPTPTRSTPSCPVRRGRTARRLRAAVDAIRCEGTSIKINLALDRLPHVVGRPIRRDGPQPYHRGILEIGPTARVLDLQQAQARSGVAGTGTHIEICFPTVHDPSLAPEGQHIATIDVNSQPYTLADGHWDDHQGRASPTGCSASSRSTCPACPRRCPPAGALAARPRAGARADRRARAARRDGAGPAVHDPPGARPRRLPHPDGRPLPLRRGHPPRRRRDRRERSQLRPRGARATARSKRRLPGLGGRTGAARGRGPHDAVPARRPTRAGHRHDLPGRELLSAARETRRPLPRHRRPPRPARDRAQVRLHASTDVDGNVFLDMASASGVRARSGPRIRGSARAGDRRARAGTATRTRTPITSELVAPLAERLVEHRARGR